MQHKLQSANKNVNKYIYIKINSNKMRMLGKTKSLLKNIKSYLKKLQKEQVNTKQAEAKK